jgi:hypothetical protein
MKRIGLSIGVWLTSLAAYADSPMVIDHAGRAIGYFEGNNCSNGALQVFSRTGYYACVDATFGTYESEIGPIGQTYAVFGYLYLTSDCSGQGYVMSSAPMGDGNPFTGGFVLGVGTGALYTPNDGSLSFGFFTPIASNSKGTECDAFDFNAIFIAMPAFPNDPAVTGLSTTHYAAPFHFDVLPDSALDDVIFFDGMGEP